VLLSFLGQPSAIRVAAYSAKFVPNAASDVIAWSSDFENSTVMQSEIKQAEMKQTKT
jgi:hypothetical protein